MLDQGLIPDRTASKVATLLAKRRPGHNLPQAFYTDPDIFDFDLRQIYGRSWLLIGFEIELPEVGSTMAITIGRTPILLMRGRDGAIRGFFNSCRHRGAQILPDGCGSARMLVCPYHQWSYDDTGALRGASKMQPDFDKATHGLKPIHVRTVAGAVFVCLAEDAPEFDDFHDKLSPLLAPHDLLHAKVAAEYTLTERCNWKLVMENGRECYHCAAKHPELSLTFPIDAGGHFNLMSDEDAAAFRARMDRLDLPHGAVEGEWWQAVRFPLRRGFTSMTVDGEPCVKKPMCSINGGAVGSLRLGLEPHSFFHALGDFLFMFSALPVGPQETVVVAKWLVHKDAEEGVDYDRDDLMRLWNETNLQDRELVENNQRGVNSLGYTPGPYCIASESLALRFTDWYVRQVGAEVL